MIEGRQTRLAQVSMLKRGDNAWIEVTIREGRKRQVRRMFLAVGHRVLKLRRVAYGGLQLGDLAPGKLRPLTRREVVLLERAGRGPASAARRSDRSN